MSLWLQIVRSVRRCIRSLILLTHLHLIALILFFNLREVSREASSIARCRQTDRLRIGRDSFLGRLALRRPFFFPQPFEAASLVGSCARRNRLLTSWGFLGQRGGLSRRPVENGGLKGAQLRGSFRGNLCGFYSWVLVGAVNLGDEVAFAFGILDAL